MYPPKPKKSDVDLVDRWNAANPIGTKVSYAKVKPPRTSSDIIETTTRTEAYLMSAMPVVMLDDVRGCVHLRHVSLKSFKAPAQALNEREG